MERVKMSVQHEVSELLISHQLIRPYDSGCAGILNVAAIYGQCVNVTVLSFQSPHVPLMAVLAGKLCAQFRCQEKSYFEEPIIYRLERLKALLLAGFCDNISTIHLHEIGIVVS